VLLFRMGLLRIFGRKMLSALGFLPNLPTRQIVLLQDQPTVVQ
jgi:hypothetical protein